MWCHCINCRFVMEMIKWYVPASSCQFTFVRRFMFAYIWADFVLSNEFKFFSFISYSREVVGFSHCTSKGLIQYKGHLASIGIRIMMIKWSHGLFIFIMGIPILVRWISILPADLDIGESSLIGRVTMMSAACNQCLERRTQGLILLIVFDKWFKQ